MDGVLWPWLWPLGTIGIAFAGFWIIIVILCIIFWLLMLVDCLQKEKFNDKLVWVVVLLFLFMLGAVLYFFLVKTKKRKR